MTKEGYSVGTRQFGTRYHQAVARAHIEAAEQFQAVHVYRSSRVPETSGHFMNEPVYTAKG